MLNPAQVKEAKHRRRLSNARKHRSYNEQHRNYLLEAMQQFIGKEFADAVTPHLKPNTVWETGMQWYLEIPGHLTITLTYDTEDETLLVNGNPITPLNLDAFVLALDESKTSQAAAPLPNPQTQTDPPGQLCPHCGEILIPEEPLTHRIHCDVCGGWLI